MICFSSLPASFLFARSYFLFFFILYFINISEKCFEIYWFKNQVNSRKFILRTSICRSYVLVFGQGRKYWNLGSPDSFCSNPGTLNIVYIYSIIIVTEILSATFMQRQASPSLMESRFVQFTMKMSYLMKHQACVHVYHNENFIKLYLYRYINS